MESSNDLATEFAQDLAQTDEIVRRLRPMLAGLAPHMQGAIVAELTAIYLSGFDESVREQLWALQKSTTERLVELWAPISRLGAK